MKRMTFIFLLFSFLALGLNGCIEYTPPPPIKTSHKHFLRQKINYTQTQHAVLLLPLTGNLASAGSAIKEGFLLAQQQTGHPIKTDIIDTNQIKPITKAYQEALSKGATIIIGPLEKANVASLAQNSLPVTTIALNQIPNTSNLKLYQFGFSPHDEACQVAMRAARDHHHTALIIAPVGEWGNGVVNAFEKCWSQSNGSIKHTLRFKLQDNLADKLRETLGISKYTTFSSFKKQAPVDMVFLAAPPAIGRQVNPLLKFYIDRHIPVYATSFIYTGTIHLHEDQDLNGILFCDIPWVLSSQSIATQLEQKDRQNFIENNRLYALGIDAYRLTLQIKDLKASSGAYIPGVTGDLYISSGQRILRQLTWAKFQQGKPHIIHK
ncbi:MAG: Penicillin-binding protein activator LpoA [Legionellaceae bacterium]